MTYWRLLVYWLDDELLVVERNILNFTPGKSDLWCQSKCKDSCREKERQRESDKKEISTEYSPCLPFVNSSTVLVQVGYDETEVDELSKTNNQADMFEDETDTRGH